ncbi:DUF2855 domain-containing protein [Kibdelosporangium aridum]|uniref:DUF2855 domain-containing protein n=1 Tax=Kibdelosporangium aridum TaxID=2030 RepID=A0A428YKH2_KIBAR|nr:DUF2855 family protein [Kibdelosporangium aridum]RSM67971.1 DUF2855 domain-containing protein [Kibdelosporangium aridum]
MSVFQALEFLRDDPLHTMRVVPDQVPDPARGSVLLRIERFVLTSNNITYARHGDRLGYWTAFPAREPGWGRVPCWGAARVVGGDPELAAPGELFVGFLPMATHVLVDAEPLPTGFRATSPERSGMYPIYRDMARVNDTIDDVGLATTGGVAATAAHLSDELQATAPAQVVFSSATSRTALTTAVVLREAGVRVVGLTAAVRAKVAARAEVFDDVLSYDDVADLVAIPGTAYVDVAGRPEITAAVARTLGPALIRSLRVGVTHALSEVPAQVSLPGPPVEQFNVGLRRIDVAGRIGAEKMAALEQAAEKSVAVWAGEHLAVDKVTGLEQVRPVWHRVLRGEADPLTIAMIVPS